MQRPRLQRNVAGGKRTSHKIKPVPNHQHSNANSTAAKVLEAKSGKDHHTGAKRICSGSLFDLTGTRNNRPKVSAACTA